MSEYKQSMTGVNLRSLLQPGVKGHLDDTEYEVMGRIRYDSGDDQWDEWCLVSSEGTYCWLLAEHGDLWLYRRQKPKQTFAIDKDTLRFDEFSIPLHEGYDAEIAAVTGRMPWNAQPGEKVWLLDFGRGGTKYTAEKSGDQLEMYRGSKLDAERFFTDFQLEAALPPYRWVRSEVATLLGKARVYLWAALACLLLVLAGNFMWGTVFSYDPLSQPIEQDPQQDAPPLPFKLSVLGVTYGPFTLAAGRTRIRVALPRKGYRTGSVAFSAMLLDDTDKARVTLKTRLFMQTVKGLDGEWPRAHLQDALEFLLPRGGTYFLKLEEGDSSGSARKGWKVIRVAVDQGGWQSGWLIATTLFFLGAWLRLKFKAAKKAHSTRSLLIRLR